MNSVLQHPHKWFCLFLVVYTIFAIGKEESGIDERLIYPFTAWDMYNDAPDRVEVFRLIEIKKSNEVEHKVWRSGERLAGYDNQLAVLKRCGRSFEAGRQSDFEPCRRYIKDFLLGDPESAYKIQRQRYRLSGETGVVRASLEKTDLLSPGDGP